MSQPQFSFRTSRGPGLTVGVLSILMGAFVIAIGFGFIHTVGGSGINAPCWVLAVFGGTFFIAGLWSIFQRAAGEGTLRASWMNFVFGLLVMLAISIICLWIGFGPGERLFVQDVGIGVTPTTRPVDPTTGRIFFGIFGVLMSGATVAFAVRQGRKLIRRGDKAA